MMKFLTKTIGLAAVLTAPHFYGNEANAEQKSGKWDAGVRLNTIGAQGEIGYLFNETFALRLQAGGFDHFKKELEFEKVKYHNVRFRPIVTTIYADWYFLTNWWRVSAGVSYNHTKIRIHQDVSHHPFPANMMQIIKANYRYKSKISPYLGTGVEFRNLFGSKFILSLDAGLNYFGEVKVKAFSKEFLL